MNSNAAGYNRNDCILLRILCLIGAIITPVIKIAWSYSIAPDEFFYNFESVIQCILYSSIFILLLVATFFVPLIRKYAYYFVYGLFFFASCALLYSVAYNDFSMQSILLLILFTTSISMFVKKMVHLVFYDIVIYTLILIALLKTEGTSLPKAFLIFIFMINYLFNYLFVKMKMNAQNALIKSEQDYRSLVEITPQAIFVCQKDKILFCNSAAVQLAGASSTGELVNQPITKFIKRDEQLQKELIEKGSPEEHLPKYHEVKFTLIDGIEVDVEASVTYVKITGQPAMMYIFKDISERKAVEKKIEQMAFYDPLTGLPNRYYLNNTLQETINTSVETNQKNAVLFADLDGFKNVNDTLGHDNGDLLLKQVAERLVKCVRTNDMVSRYGGDEFVILLNGSNKTNAHSVAQRILNAFGFPFNINGNDLYITPSIGISLYPYDGNSVSTLVKNADSAMYMAKEKGKNNFQYYSNEK